MIEIIPNWHPILVHFTVGLLLTAVLLFVVARLVGNVALRRQWEIVAQWNLWLGAAVTVLTVIAGIVAYNSVAHDTPSHAAMTEHRNWALLTAVLFLVLAVWSALRARAKRTINGPLLAGLLLAGGLLLTTAWHGGEIVYRYGLGVMSLPKTDSHGHADAHDGQAGGDDHHGSLSSAPDARPSAEEEVIDCELPTTPPVTTEPHEHADGHSDHPH
ncbi:MAG: DUF2231 domain-containing protein [Gammaproteobacteria bacterium]|nr:DUF2231 domain-containing protein [Gammaproteobacteria bacterium]